MLAVVAVPAGVWWLFAGTVRQYRGGGEDGSIRFAHFGSYEDFVLWGEIITAFEAEHTGVRIRREYVPGWYGRYETKLRQQILSDTLPDVVLMQSTPFRMLAEHFAAVTELRESDSSAVDATDQFHKTAVAAFSVVDEQTGEPQLRGLPLAGGNLLIYYNPASFDAADRYRKRKIDRPTDDWTLEQFASTARDLTCDFDGDGRIDQFGFWLPRWIYYLPFLWSFGAEVVDGDPAHWAMRGPSAERAFAYYRDLARDRRVCPRPDEVPQLIQDMGFLTGKTAMCINGPWFEPFLSRTHLRDTYRTVHIPQGPGGRTTRIAWDGLCMTDHASPERRRAAQQFLRYCASPTVQRRLARTGRYIPALKSAAAEFDAAGTNRRRRKFVEALSYSRLQPYIENFNAVDRAVGRHLERFIDDTSTTTPHAFLAELAADPAVVHAFSTQSASNR